MPDIIAAKLALPLLTKLVSSGAEFFIRKRDERLIEFYQNLLDGNVTQERIDYETDNIDINEKFDEINTYLNSLLTKNSIQLSGNSNLSALQGYVKQKNIICALTKRKMDIEAIEILKKYANTHNIIKICFEENVDDQLSEIKGGLNYLEKDNEDLENLFISKFI